MCSTGTVPVYFYFLCRQQWFLFILYFFVGRPHAHTHARACTDFDSASLFVVALMRKLGNFTILLHPDFSDGCKLTIIVLQV